jgi:hypothetical protein
MQELQDFLQHLNSIHANIKFTVESLYMEIIHLKKTIRHHGYRNHEVLYPLAPRKRSETEREIDRLMLYQQYSTIQYKLSPTKAAGFSANTTLRQFTHL